MNLAGHCAGCGVNNQSCKIAKCSMERGNVEYCFQCGSFPCEKYAHIEVDSFITHQNQLQDQEKAQRISIPAYNAQQEEKRQLLETLLAAYNDGRKKTLFCIAVNLLPAEEIQSLLQQAQSQPDFQAMEKQAQSAHIARQLQALAASKGIRLALRKKR